MKLSNLDPTDTDTEEGDDGSQSSSAFIHKQTYRTITILFCGVQLIYNSVYARIGSVLNKLSYSIFCCAADCFRYKVSLNGDLMSSQEKISGCYS